MDLAEEPARAPQNCRAYPDEKGIETFNESFRQHNGLIYCRAYPDEKGIETDERGTYPRRH